MVERLVTQTIAGLRSEAQRQCGWTLSFTQGCVTPLECVQHEYGPPERLHKLRMPLCIFGDICHHLRALVVSHCLY